jgi:DNA-binding NarL/FixJ family response regulator
MATSASVRQYRVLAPIRSTIREMAAMHDARIQRVTEVRPSCGILVVDDHGIVREGLIALLKRQGDIDVLGSAISGAEAIAAAQRLKPTIIIMDLFLPDMSGIDATTRILASLPLTRVIMLSARHTSEHVYGALRAGALGYVVKDAPADELLQAVRSIREGKRYLSPQVAPAVGDATCYSLPKSPLERLSMRERDVLHRIVAGGSSAAIGQHMSLSPKTIDTYRGRLMTKLGVRNRSELIRFVIENEITA